MDTQTAVTLTITVAGILITAAINIVSHRITIRATKEIAKDFGELAALRESQRYTQERDLAVEQALLMQLHQAVQHARTIGRTIRAPSAQDPTQEILIPLPTQPFQAVFSPQYRVLARYPHLLLAVTDYLMSAHALNHLIALRNDLLARAQAERPGTLRDFLVQSLTALTDRLHDPTPLVATSPDRTSNCWKALALIQFRIEAAIPELKTAEPFPSE